jgi:TIGR03009 family protein
MGPLHVALAQQPQQQQPRPAAQPPKADPAARPAANQPAPAIDPTGQRMQQLVALWAERSTMLKSLDVQIERVDHSAAWGDEKYEGRAMFKSPNRAWLEFKKVDPATKKAVPHERIVCTGSEVWQYRSDAKQLFIHKLDRETQQRALQEGPLPFLFNFRAEDARKRYRMKLVSQNAQAYQVDVVPLLKIDKECFSAARIQLDAKYLLPTGIVLVDPEGKNYKYFKLHDIKPNHPVNEVNFQPRPVEGWKTIVNEEDGQAPAPRVGQAGSAPAPRGAAPRATTRPRGRFD